MKIDYPISDAYQYNKSRMVRGTWMRKDWEDQCPHPIPPGWTLPLAYANDPGTLPSAMRLSILGGLMEKKSNLKTIDDENPIILP